MKDYQEALQLCKEQGTYRTLASSKGEGKYIVVHGQKLLNLSGNDYLGLLDIPQLWQEFLDSAPHFAPSSASSRLLSGNNEAYTLFEEELKSIYYKESALLWDSGYHANSGILPVLTLPHTLIVADRLVHASIIDGVRLSGAPFVRYRHNDLEHLTKILDENHQKYERIWIVTESLFSMDGDFAPLKEIINLKKKYNNLFLYLDEAHTVGVRGTEGLGYASELGVLDEIDLFIGTLGKALGSVGAYSLQSQTLKELFISKARPMIFSTALPPVMIQWSRFIFHKQMKMNDRREHLREIISLFSQLMGQTYTSQIAPIIIPSEEILQQKTTQLTQAGYFVRPIRKPTVPAGSERIRISLNAALTIDEVQTLATELLR